MKKTMKSRVFIATFLLAYFLFFIATMWIFEFQTPAFATSTDYGFPFAYYHSHCFGGNWDLIGFAGNMVVAVSLSLLIGLSSSYIWLRFSSPEFRHKWHLKF